jgi:GT2 family glycosyltransferase
MLENLIVPVLNRYDLLQRMLDSIDVDVEHLLIIDNGASQHPDDLPVNTLHINDHVSAVTYLPMPTNLGVSASWNLGIKSFPHHNNWFFASNDMQFLPGGLQRLSESRSRGLVLSDMFPFWQTFSVGYDLVRDCGLFDEGFFPAYFEDNDMVRRVTHAGLPIDKVSIPSEHDNSSTINSDRRLLEQNGRTFSSNQRYFQDKVNREDFGQGAWSIMRRRENSWD